MNREEALAQNPAFPCPREILDRQVLVEVDFYDFDGDIAGGVIVVDRDLASDVSELFEQIFIEGFPIAAATPVADLQFEWDDDRSMAANNTSGFNYRPMTGSGSDGSGAGTSRLSAHARGRAIDINPLLNPYLKGKVIRPEGAVYDPARPGTITADSFIVKFLKERGWTWGGDWASLKDYQHFEKV
jgi:peptidoglycan L-alanyl-D-glutamate endopeptidase CwlK